MAPAQEAPTTRKGTTSPATQVIRPSSAPRRNAAAAMAAATLSTEASAIATEATTTDTDAAATVPKGGRLEMRLYKGNKGKRCFARLTPGFSI